MKDRKRTLKYVEPVEHKQWPGAAAAAQPMQANPNGYYRLDNVLSRATESERRQIMRSMGMVAVNGDKLHFKTKEMKMDNKSKTQGKQNKGNRDKFSVFQGHDWKVGPFSDIEIVGNLMNFKSSECYILYIS